MKRKILIVFCIAVYLSVFSGCLYASETVSKPLTEWLVLGPAPVPALETAILKGDSGAFGFDYLRVGALKPEANQKINWLFQTQLTWKKTGKLNFEPSETSIIYLATYINPKRWVQSKLIIETQVKDLSLYVDGNAVTAESGENKRTASLPLTHENHILIIKALLPKGQKAEFNISMELETPFQTEDISFTVLPERELNVEDILNVINVMNINVSPNGKLVAVKLSQTDRETGKREFWTEILNAASGACIFSSKGMGSLENLQWLRNSTSFTFTQTPGEETAIIQYDLNTNKTMCLKKGISDFSDYTWAEDNSFMIYSTSKVPKAAEDHHYIKDLTDRSPFFANKTTYYLFYPGSVASGNSGVVHPIGDEEQNYSGAFISPDCKKVLLLQTLPDYQNRPYSKTGVSLLDLNGMKIDKLFETSYIEKFFWSRDNDGLLLIGSPAAFDDAGRSPKLGKETIANDYDLQLYYYHLKTKKAESLSIQFDPAISHVADCGSTGVLYVRATEKTFERIYQYSMVKKKYTMMHTGVEVVDNIGYAANDKSAVFLGTSAAVPQRLYKLNLSTDRSTLLKDYNKEAYQHVKMCKCVPEDIAISKDTAISGHLYYPVSFDPNQKYPCIVYYYGGTSPVESSFGGRYPREWYAANGYIVYVLQPTGTIGYGQEASAVHVNDWGKVTSAEIITAVKELVKKHPYIDSTRIGAMGASYGGFLTQYLATQTNLFAAFISHAGISALPSYWGVGDWGYNYSGTATANSFPWNRKDIYVGHSPLFMADRIQNPLLLLHGENDNNVPPGESYQMFAALKLLGKDVALVTYPGQDHFITEYKKRINWMRTIIAWWDKYLKNQPEHWDYMYKK